MDAALFREPRRRMISLADGEMAALDFGDAARPVELVFLHANGFNAMTYRSLLGPLSLSTRILACDLRGHGRTRLPTGPGTHRSWGVFRDDLLALMNTLGPSPLVLAGHSMGATVSLLAADRAPAQVKALVLLEPVILPRWANLYARTPFAYGRLRRLPLVATALRRRSVFESVTEAFSSYAGRGAFKTWPETMLADYLADGLRERPEGGVELACAPAWEAANYAAQANDTWGALARLQRPVSILTAERDSTCALGHPAGLMRRNPDFELAMVPGTTHFLPMERPNLVQDALLDAVEL